MPERIRTIKAADLQPAERLARWAVGHKEDQTSLIVVDGDEEHVFTLKYLPDTNEIALINNADEIIYSELLP